MPIYDRSYYRDDYSRTQRGGYSPGASGPRSVVITLIIVNAAIFLLDAFTVQVTPGSNWLAWFMSLKVNLPDLPFWQRFPFNIWQLLTYGFAHASISSQSGIFHVLINMLALFFLGRPIEQRYGSEEFFKFYMAALLFAGVVSFLYLSLLGQPAILVGASGAVTAVVMLFIFHYPKQTLLIYGILPAPAWLIGVILIGSEILTGLQGGSQIGWYAHLAGALFAFIYFKSGFNFKRLDFSGVKGWFEAKSKPKLKVHRGSQVDDSLKRKADEVLDKLHREGEESLTKKERKILENYSRSVRHNRDS